MCIRQVSLRAALAGSVLRPAAVTAAAPAAAAADDDAAAAMGESAD